MRNNDKTEHENKDHKPGSRKPWTAPRLYKIPVAAVTMGSQATTADGTSGKFKPFK